MALIKSVVTGGAGFIGSNLTRHLLHEGHDVVVIDNMSTGRRSNLAGVEHDIEFIEGDIRDRDLLITAFKNARFVFHQAALGSVPRSIADPWTSHDNNVNGSLSVLLAAQQVGVGRVIYAASSSAYGNTPVLPKVESMASTPLSPYAITKYVGELYGRVFYQVYGLETVAMRYFNVFGPRQNPASQYAAVIPKFISGLLKGEPPVIHGNGEQTRDFTYVENAVAANLAAALAPTKNVAGEVFNIGCGDRISLNNLVEAMQEIIGTRLSPVYVESRSGDVRDSLADIRKAKEAFGYTPLFNVRQGLELTVQWLRENR